MTAITLGLFIALHGLVGQVVISSGTFQGVVFEGTPPITFNTTEARGSTLRGYQGDLFPRTEPFGLEDSQVIDSSNTLVEPYGTVPGANGELVAPRDDSIPEDEDTTCDFCPSS